MAKGFYYTKETTRTVCRGCGNDYIDFYFSNVSGDCADCSVNSSHCGFTNLLKFKQE